MARLFDDASSEYLYKLSAPVTAEPLTMACWFNSNDITVNNSLICLGENAVAGLWRIGANGNVAGDPIRATKQSGAGNSNADSTSGYSANTWHHAAGVFTSNTSRAAYLDGGNKGTDTTSITDPSVSRTSIGANLRDVAAAYMSGSIAEVGIWDVALTDAEIASLAAGVSPLMIRPASLVLYVPLMRDEDQDFIAGLVFNANGTPTVSTHPRIIRTSAQILQFPTAVAGGAFKHYWSTQRAGIIGAGI